MKRVLSGFMVSLVLSVLFFSLVGMASADITLGSISGENYLKLERGHIGRFKAMFFNLGDDPLLLELDADCHRDLRVEIHPESSVLNCRLTNDPDCADCEWFILSDGRTYVRMDPVYIYVKIPQEITRNHYEVKITAIASDIREDEIEGITQSMAQAREFLFSVYVPGEIVPEQTPDPGVTGDDYDDEDLYEGIDIEEEWRKQQERGGIVDEGEDVSGGEDTGGDATKEVSGRDATGTPNSGDLGSDLGIISPGDKTTDEDTGLFGLKTDEQGRTEMKLPVGKVVLSKEQTESAVDLGLITLIVSIGSLAIRILK